MLEDVQERLVYRTHIYIQTDITGYKPAPGDLAYPDKLEMMEVWCQLFYCPWLLFFLNAAYTILQYSAWQMGVFQFLGAFSVTGAIKLVPADQIMTLN